MNSSTYEAAVLAKMPFKTLTKVGEDPNCVELSKIRREVYRNCAAVHSTQNGNNGHLGLVVEATKYAMRTGGVAYIVSPQHPGTYDPNIAASSGQVVQSQREAKHNQLIEDHIIEEAVLQVCKNQLQEALPRWLLSKIEDRDT
eukprot:488523-Ditylum_brightwellii.AAC.1